MKIKKLEWADAFLIGDATLRDLTELLVCSGLSTVYVEENNLKFNIVETRHGNRLAIPYLVLDGYKIGGPRQVSAKVGWPILPLVKHRGGYCTATARCYMEFGAGPNWNGIYVKTDMSILKLTAFGGKYPRTRNRVFYADRTRHVIVVDVIGRPKDTDNV